MAKKMVKDEEEEIIEEVEEEVELEKEEDKEDYEPLSVEDRLINVEKKLSAVLILSIITVALSLIVMIVVLGNSGDNNKANSNYSNSGSSSESSGESSNYSYDTSAFKEISAQDIASESKGKTIAVMIGRQGCGYCAMYAPIIQKVASENGVTIRYIDFLKIVDISAGTVKDSDAYNLIKNLDAASDWTGFGETALKGTPNTLFIKNNKIIYGINGYQEEDNVRSAFKAAGLSK